MPTMIRGYNAEGESQVFEDSLPEGWGIAKPAADQEPDAEASPAEPADPPKRRRRSSRAQKD